MFSPLRLLAAGAFTGIFPLTWAGDAPVEADVEVALRSVQLTGDRFKYRQLADLGEGLHLRQAALRYAAPAVGDARWIDALTLTAEGFGGEPRSAASAEFSKHGVYRLNIEHSSADIYYEDVLIDPADVVPSAANVGDLQITQHRRVRDRLNLRVTPTPALRAHLDYARLHRRGTGQTALDISREEFELDRRVHDDLDTVDLGIDYGSERLALAVNQRWRRFDDDGFLSLASASDGLNPQVLTRLDTYLLSRPARWDSRETSVQAQLRPNERLWIDATALRLDLDGASHARETLSGVDFANRPLQPASPVSADVDLDVRQGNLAAYMVLTPALLLRTGIGGERRRQDGVVTSADDGESWRQSSRNASIGVEWTPARSWSLAGGWTREWRHVRRVLTDAAAPPREKNRLDGLYLRAAFSPSSRLRVDLSAETNRYDDAFTLLAPTASNRLRLTGRYRLGKTATLSLAYAYRGVDNDASGWASDTQQIFAGAAYTRNRHELALNAGIILVDSAIDQTVRGGTRQALYAINYTADTCFTTATWRWQPTGRIDLRFDASVYRNRGSFDHQRWESGSELGYQLSARYRLVTRYRHMNLDEDFEAFTANLWELGLRVSL